MTFGAVLRLEKKEKNDIGCCHPPVCALTSPMHER
jgi:hypothetical protein